MLATIASAALHGIDAEIVHVEVNAGEAGEPRLFNVMSILYFFRFHTLGAVIRRILKSNESKAPRRKPTIAARFPLH